MRDIIPNCKNTFTKFTKFEYLLVLNYWVNFIIYILVIITLLRYIHWFKLVSQVSDVAYVPLLSYSPERKKILTKLNLILQNNWVNFNHTWHKVSLGEGDSSLFKWRVTPFLVHLTWEPNWAFLSTCRPSSVSPSVYPSVYLKLFTFSSSSPESLGQIQPNFSQSIPTWRRFKFVQMKGHALPKGEIIGNY